FLFHLTAGETIADDLSHALHADPRGQGSRSQTDPGLSVAGSNPGSDLVVSRERRIRFSGCGTVSDELPPPDLLPVQPSADVERAAPIPRQGKGKTRLEPQYRVLAWAALISALLVGKGTRRA